MSSLVDIISTGLQEGLPHPGNKEADQPPHTILMPGMNFRGIPKQVMEKFAEEAGLPSADLPKLVAEALINLIQTKGECDIVPRKDSEAPQATPEPTEDEIVAEEPVETPVAPPTEHQWSTPTVDISRTAAARRARASQE